MKLIELHGAQANEPVAVIADNIQAFLPCSTLGGAPRGARTQVFMQGCAFFVTETPDQVKTKIIGLPIAV